MRTPEFWECDEYAEGYVHKTPDEAIEYYLDAVSRYPETVTVYGYARVQKLYEPDPVAILECVLDGLDEEYGGEEAADPTEAMLAAARTFVDAVMAEYVPWSCERVEGAEMVVNVHDWIVKHRPDWPEDR